MRKHTFTRYYASYVSIFGLCTTSRFDEFRKAAGDYAALYSGKAEEIITSRSILTIPIGIRMNFARGLSVMADGFTRICSSVMIPIKESDCGYSGETDNLAGRYAESGLFCHRRTEVCTAG